jgi:hypothetical protein
VKRFGIVVAAVVLAATQGMAAMLSQGTRELSLTGEASDNGDGMDLTLEASGGYFFMENIEGGGQVGVTYSDRDDFTTMLMTMGVAGEYNYPVPDLLVVPYGGVGAAIGYWSWETDHADDSDVVLILSGWVGAKYYVVESLAIGCQLEMDFATDDIYDDGDSMDWKFMLRTSFYF